MRHDLMKKVATVVLFTFISMVILPNYSFANDRMKELEDVKTFYAQENYTDANEKTNDIIKKYGGEEEYKSEICEAFFYKAKICLMFEKYREMETALQKLFELDIEYELPEDEDTKLTKNENIKFREIARGIQKIIKDKHNKEIEAKKKLYQEESRENKFFVTITIKDFSEPLYISLDNINKDNRYDPKNEIKLSVNEKGTHTIYFISGNKYVKEQVVINNRDTGLITTLDFIKYGKKLPKQKHKNVSVIPKESEGEKKKSFPVVAIIAGTVVAAALIVFVLMKKKSNETTPPVKDLFFVTDAENDKLSMNEGETKTLKVKLSGKPSNITAVSVIRVSGDPDIIVESGGSIEFTTLNWDQFHLVIIKAVEDGDTIDDEATIRIQASGIPSKDIVVTSKDTGTGGRPSYN